MTYIGKIPPNSDENNASKRIREKIWLLRYLLSGEALNDAKRMNSRKPLEEPLDLIYGDPTITVLSQRQRLDA